MKASNSSLNKTIFSARVIRMHHNTNRKVMSLLEGLR